MFKTISSLKLLTKISFSQKTYCFSLEKIKSFYIKFPFSITKMESLPEVKKEVAKEKELPQGTLEDFVKLDIRVGEITECWKVFALIKKKENLKNYYY